MRIIFILFGLSLISTAQAFGIEDLIGVWQSNEKMTLESMEKIPDIPEKSRTLFRNGFFGRLIVVVKRNESAAYFADERPEKLDFQKHVIHQISETEFDTSYPDTHSEANTDSIITMQGSCYFQTVSKWKFREYFCRVK